jgi:hypothetical protein
MRALASFRIFPGVPLPFLKGSLRILYELPFTSILESWYGSLVPNTSFTKTPVAMDDWTYFCTMTRSPG